MSNDQCNLQWSLFEYHLINSNRELYNEKHFADVTLVSQDMKKFQAHKAILGTASSVLKGLFLAKPEHKMTILLKGIMEQELTQMLRFIYLGEAFVDVERISKFEEAARYLNIKVLEEMSSNLRRISQPAEQKVDTSVINMHERQSGNCFNSSQQGIQDTLFVNVNSDENTVYIDPKLNSSLFQQISQQNYNPSKVNSDQGKVDETYETIGSPKTKFIKNYPPGPTSSAYNFNNETSNRIKKENKEITKSLTQIYDEVTPKHLYKKYNITWNSTQCPECQMKFTRSSSLMEHIRIQHEGIRYPCNQCDYKATKLYSLKFHMETKHISEERKERFHAS